MSEPRETATDMERFCEIVRRGGQIVCAPDTYAKLVEALRAANVTPTVTTIRSSRFMPPGSMCAVARRSRP